MSTIGESPAWRASLLSVYELVREGILRTWPDCRDRIRSAPIRDYPVPTRRRRKGKEKLEDPITRDLIRRLRLDGEIRTRFLHVESQRELVESSLDGDPDPTGYIDIAILFFVGADEACLALECKRLNVVWPSKRSPTPLAREYVYEGMMRFVSGQYSKDCDVGGMIGYVMDGNVIAAHESVLQQIKEASEDLLCDPSRMSILSYPDYFSTTHARKPAQIELRHQLLSGN